MASKNMSNKFAIAILLIQVVLIESKLYVSSYQNKFYKKYTNKISKNVVIETYQTTMSKCAKLCAQKPLCVGFNVGSLNTGKKMVKDCNITKATTISWGKPDSETRVGFGYYEKLKCDMMLKGTMPCPQGFICCPDTKPQICPPNYRGTNCSKACSSYILYHKDLSFGKNLEQLDYITNSAVCWDACWANTMCLSFTYVPLYSQCYLKDMNDVTHPRSITAPSPVDTNLYVFDCRPYDRKDIWFSNTKRICKTI